MLLSKTLYPLLDLIQLKKHPKMTEKLFTGTQSINSNQPQHEKFQYSSKSFAEHAGFSIIWLQIEKTGLLPMTIICISKVF